LLLSTFVAQAQASDSLFVTSREDGWIIQHRVRPGETIFSLARRYHVPPAIFAELNGKTFSDGLREGSIVAIPLGAYNQITRQPSNITETRVLYYRVRTEDDLLRIARGADVTRRTLQAWNALPGTDKVDPGTVLKVGWVLFDPTVISTPKAVLPAQTQKPANVPIIIPKPARKDSADIKAAINKAKTEGAKGLATVDSIPTIKGASSEEQSYIELVSAGVDMVVESGPAVFFPSSSRTTVYAFHNIAPRGGVIKVRNPVNGKVVYAKVLGPMPTTKNYQKALVGLSGGARAALGTHGDTRLWCEISYAGY
jgi:LysM repeat protein